MKKVLGWSCVVWGLAFVLRGEAKVDSNALVGVWLFDEGNGDTAKDTSGKKADGKLMKSPKWVDGKFGKALEFDFGGANYVLVPLPPNGNTISISVWAKYKALPTANSGLFQGQATDNPDGAPADKIIGIWLENTQLLWGRIITAAGVQGNFPKKQNLAAEKWYHIAVVISADDKKGRQYVDGALVGEVDYDGKLGAYQFAKIGRQGTESWTGAIDEVVVTHQALSAEDVKALGGGLSGTLAVRPKDLLASAWAELKR